MFEGCGDLRMSKVKHSSLVLGSGSPRRLQLLRQVGISVTVRVANIDETPRIEELPRDYVVRMARSKLAALLTPEHYVLTADTIVVAADEILGKPRSAEQATQMLALLSGRTHTVMTAIALGRHEEFEHRVVKTDVEFMDLSAEQIRDYVANGEGRDKAGGYAAQGLAAGFIVAFAGSYTNVVGLPLAQTIHMLRAHRAIDVWPPRS